MFKAVLEITKEPKIFYEALKPESEFKSARAICKLKLEQRKLRITVEAKDATAFRATLNSLTGVIAVISASLGKAYKG